MTQDERWLAKYNEVKTFIETNHRNPSKHAPEERFKYYNWLKHNRQLMNAGEMKQEKVELFEKLLALCEEYRKKNNMSDIIASLGRLTQRVNVMTRYPNDKLVIIYDDHRWLLNVLFKIQKDGLLEGPPKLVFFDSHDDAGHSQKKSELLSHLGVENVLDATEKAFSSFVDYDIRTDDGNWLSVACELNLVSDAVVIGDKYSHNIEEMNGAYMSEDGTEHRLYNLSDNLDFELGCRGSLGDHAREDEFRDIRAFFNSRYGYDHARIGDMTPFVLDFDLDFFTLDTNEGTLAWPRQIWQKHFDCYSDGTQMVRDLINKAMVITICREPDYCGSIGGIAGSNYNLQNLDNFFFEGQLGTNLFF